MSVRLEIVSGDDNVTYAYLRGTHESNPLITETWSIVRAALANGSVSLLDTRDSLVAKLEAQYANYQASQALLQQL